LLPELVGVEAESRMMDESKVKEIATANLQRLTDQLRLWEWRIDIYTGRLDGSAVA